MPTWLRNLILTLCLLGVTSPALAACGSDETVAPAVFTTPTGQQCAAWVNNPHETDGSGLRPCDFPIPTTQPVRQPGMSDADYFLLGALFSYGLGHHDYYYSDSYYNSRIGPAWSRYPGTYYGYGHQPVTRINNVNVYNTTINNVNTKYAAQEKTYAANPKTGGYTGSSGKSYTGTSVPAKAFANTNAPAKSGGNAGITGSSSGKSSTGSSSGKGGYSPSTGSSGKGGYSPPSSGGSRSSGGGRR